MRVKVGLKDIITERFLSSAIKYRSKIFSVTLFVFSFLITQSVFASPVNVNAKADTAQIKIGEQFHVTLSATASPGIKISFPLLTDTFNHFEVVTKGKIDTVSSKDQKELTLQQLITLTSFDSGYYVLPPLPFVVSDGKGKSDTMLTEAFLMSVVTVPVDTTKEIRAIKGIIDVPFPWMDYLIYFVILTVVGLLAFYLIKRFGKKEIIIRKPVIPSRPAHEIALEGLRRIEEEKLWQQGYTKKYFSEVTDIIRQYIEGRFSFFAMEQTTDEILNHFTNGIIRDDERDKLKFILRHADMVKFAKAQSLPNENETVMQFAYDFINNTRPVIKEDFGKEEIQK